MKWLSGRTKKGLCIFSSVLEVETKCIFSPQFECRAGCKIFDGVSKEVCSVMETTGSKRICLRFFDKKTFECRGKEKIVGLDSGHETIKVKD